MIIDSLVHPLADEHWSFVIADGVLHALNEQDPIQSINQVPEIQRARTSEKDSSRDAIEYVFACL